MARLITRIAPDVGWLPVSFANVYFIGRPGGKWVLVDAGMPGRANEIMDAAEARFGAASGPEAILLPPGLLVHAGWALPLAGRWDWAFYHHRLERLYLLGKFVYLP